MVFRYVPRKAVQVGHFSRCASNLIAPRGSRVSDRYSSITVVILERFTLAPQGRRADGAGPSPFHLRRTGGEEGFKDVEESGREGVISVEVGIP